MNLIEQGGRFRIGGELDVCRMAYGALHLLDASLDAYGPPAAGVDPNAILRRVIELGINLIDTADIYGPGTNELQISAALYPYPSNLVISTKGGLTRPRAGELNPNNDPAHLRSAVEESLRRLKRDRLDVWTLHRIDGSRPIEEVAGTLADMRREGKIRHVGLSEPTIEQIARANSIVPIANVQSLYNVADRRNDAVVDYCAAHGISFMAYFPLAKGRADILRTCVGDIAAKRDSSIQQIALAWLLDRSPVIIPIPGTGIRAELEANVAACGIRLSAEEVAHIDAQQKLAAPPPQTSNTVKSATVRAN